MLSLRSAHEPALRVTPGGRQSALPILAERLAAPPRDGFVRTPFQADAMPAAPAAPAARLEASDAAAEAIASATPAISLSRAAFAAAAVLATTLGASLAAPLAAAQPPAAPAVSQEVPGASAVAERATETPSVLVLGKPAPSQRDAAIEQAWVKQGGAQGELGNPTSPIVDIGTSPWSGKRALMQTFEGGSIIKRQDGSDAGKVYILSPSTTAWYIEIGGAQSSMGLPIGSEGQSRPSYYATTSTYQEFEGGSVHTHSSGDHKGERYVVRPLFYDHYYGMGGAQSWLGLPVSNDFKWNGGLRQDCEGGAMFRDNRGHVTWLQYQGESTPASSATAR